MFFMRSDVPTSCESDRLLIRRLELKDDKALYAAARESIPDVFPFLPWCHPDYDISETRQWLITSLQDWEDFRSYEFAIIRKSDGLFLGGIGLSRDEDHPIANLGYWVRSSATSQGIATEAATCMAQFGFVHLKLMRIEIIMSLANQPSQRVAEKVGAVHEGILRNRLLLHGRCHDAHSYSLLRSDAGLI